MSQHEHDTDPARRRAGLLSALVKNYVNVKKLIERDGSAEDGIQLREKLNDQYVSILIATNSVSQRTRIEKIT